MMILLLSWQGSAWAAGGVQLAQQAVPVLTSPTLPMLSSCYIQARHNVSTDAAFSGIHAVLSLACPLQRKFSSQGDKGPEARLTWTAEHRSGWRTARTSAATGRPVPR